MKRHKRNKTNAKATMPPALTAGRWVASAAAGTPEPGKDQTRLAAIPMVFTPAECLRLIADFTPHLKPALVESMDPVPRIRKSSAVFVFPNPSTNWVFERLGKAIREINDAVMDSTSVNSEKAFSSPVMKLVSTTDRTSILVRASSRNAN